MLTRRNRYVWVSRLQFIWIFYTIVYISIGHQFSKFLTPREWPSSLLITIGSAIVLSIMFHSLHERNSREVNNRLFIILVTWVFFIENTISRDDLFGFVFSSIFFVLIGWLIWASSVEKFKLIHQRYTVFIAMLSAIVCSFIQLAITLLIKYIDAEIFSDHKYYLVGPHGLGIFVALIVALWFGIRLLSMPEFTDFMALKNFFPRLFALAIALLMVPLLYFAYECRLNSYFGDRALIFVMAYTIVQVLTLLIIIHITIGVKKTPPALVIFVVIAIAYPVISSILASIVIWVLCLQNDDHLFLVRWLVFEYLPSFTLGLSLFISISGAKIGVNFVRQ